jgi:hypothetical protein
LSRSWLGPLVLDLALLATGASLLYGLGLVRGARALARLAGLAFVLGWAALGSALSLFLVLGLAGGTAELSLGFVLLVGLGLGASRVIAARPARPCVAHCRLDRWLLAVAATVATAYLGLQLARVVVDGTGSHWYWDAWAFWIPKAKSIFFFGGLDTSPGGFTSFPSPAYPPLLPAMQAAVFAAAGRADAGLLPVQEWLLAAGFLGALSGLLVPRVSGRALAPALLLVGVTPGFAKYIGSGLADEPLAFLIALSGLALLLAQRERDGRLLGLAAILAGAAALTKQEGLPLALLVVLAAALGALVVGERRSAARTATVAIAPLLATIAWRLWLHLNDVHYRADYSPARLLHPRWLIDHAGRLHYALGQVARTLFLSTDVWLLIALLAIALSLLLLRRAPEIALFAPTTLILGMLGFDVTYWIGRLPVVQWASTSTERVISSVVLSVAAMLPLLIERGLEPASAGAPGEQPSLAASSLTGG